MEPQRQAQSGSAKRWVEVFLVHPGGPFWAKKDNGAWSIVKGEYDPEIELDPAQVAMREFQEETGQESPTGDWLLLVSVATSGDLSWPPVDTFSWPRTQDTIHPFHRGSLREMHLHDLPWPRDVLAELGEVPVKMRVTLSYFIEPSPTRRGWSGRYRYGSHQLRFDIREADETNDEFRKRINKKALGEKEERPLRSGGSDGWYLGSETRNRGSIHSDIWEGTASDLAARGLVAVYPVTGWWKELQARDQSDFGARYALLISIETPIEDVDIWTPVAAEVGIPIIIET